MTSEFVLNIRLIIHRCIKVYATKMSIPDDFILFHNRSVTPGVCYMTLRGAKDYSVVLDSRDHSLYLYVDSSTGQNFMHHINAKACRRKLVHVLRDKFNEADRPFVPSFFNSVVAYEEYFKQKPIETRPAMLMIKENRPIYPIYPVFAVQGAPLVTLLLRIRTVFDFLVTQNDYLPSIMSKYGTEQDIDILDSNLDRNVFDQIVKRTGQQVLNELTLIRTEETSVDKLMPKITSELGFKSFDVISEQAYMIKLSQITEVFKHFNVFPEYVVVDVDKNFDYDISVFRTYNLVSMSDSNGVLYEIVSTDDSNELKVIKVDGLSYTNIDLTRDKLKPVLLLLRNSKPLDDVQPQSIVVNGKYLKPEVTEKIIMPFRTPVSCKQSQLDSDDITYPCYVQRKYDGNRTIVYSLLGGEIIRFYSRSGYRLSSTFNVRFTEEIRRLSIFIGKKLGKPLINLHFDFECYDHGTIHSTIAGLCNAKTFKEGFENLKLHLLSSFVLDDIHKYVERKRDYTASDMNFKQIIEFSNSFGLPCPTVEKREAEMSDEDIPFKLLCVSESKLINDYEELCEFMKDSTHNNYEGLVVYPLDNHYVFGHDRLFKIKKVYDGEVRVLSYIESDIEPGAIGSVVVESKPYFGIKSLSSDSEIGSSLIQYKVTASLRKEFKDNSMHNELFKTCVGKFFTIICDSFSNTGIPMHSRFKAPLHPDSARQDVDEI